MFFDNSTYKIENTLCLVTRFERSLVIDLSLEDSSLVSRPYIFLVNFVFLLSFPLAVPSYPQTNKQTNKQKLRPFDASTTVFEKIIESKRERSVEFINL